MNELEDLPAKVAQYAAQVVEYVRRSLAGILEYESDTLPVLDHYLRTVDEGAATTATIELVVATGAAYFGEVVRRQLGGRWEAAEADATRWRFNLSTGISFSPAAFVAAAIHRSNKQSLVDVDTDLDAPPRMRTHLQAALLRMGAVTEDEFYSLCGRLDTLEHVHETLVGVAAQMLGDSAASSESEATDEDDSDEEPVEPSATIPEAAVATVADAKPTASLN